MRVKLNIKGFVELRNSPAVVADLQARARRIAAAAGDGMEVKPAETNHRFPKGRARVAVVTGTYDAMRREAKTRDLTRAIDAGRG